MWRLVKELGDGERLVMCPECEFQMVVQDKLPSKCPHCGEIMKRSQEPVSIDINKSNIDIEDEDEVPVAHDDEWHTPVYKLWYFWLIIAVIIGLLIGGGYVVRNILSHTPEVPSGNGTVVEKTDYRITVPVGWSSSETDIYVDPDGLSGLMLYEHKVSRWLKAEDAADLIKELSGSEKVTDKEVGSVKGKLISRKLERTDADGYKMTVYYSRFVFIHKNVMHMITYYSPETGTDTFDNILKTIELK